VTGLPGHNAAHAALADKRAEFADEDDLEDLAAAEIGNRL
jgi:hypothetical protein